MYFSLIKKSSFTLRVVNKIVLSFRAAKSDAKTAIRAHAAGMQNRPYFP